MLERRAIGNTGIDVSIVGLGTVKLGRNRAVRYPHPFDLPDDDAVRRLLDAASDCGVNLVDTAPAYGSSEERLGALLPGPRDRWVISTKAGENFDGARSTFDFTPEAIRAGAERSLHRLRVDHLDVLLIHSDGSDIDIIRRHGVFDVLDDLRRDGLVRACGMSTKTIDGTRLAAERADVLMVTLNRADDAALDVIRDALRNDVGIFVKKALDSGHAAAAPGDDPVRAALGFVFDAAPVTSVVIGTLSPAHLRANVAAATAAARGNTPEDNHPIDDVP